MHTGLTAEQIGRYEHDGVVFPIRAVRDGAVARSLQAIRQIAAQSGGRLNRIDFCHLFFRWAFDLITAQTVLDAVEDVVGPNILVHSARVLHKHPRDPSYVSWHQDGAHTDLDSSPMVTAWIALTACNRENGCLRVIEGSHRGPILGHEATVRDHGALNNSEIPRLAVQEERVVDVLLEAGEMSLHHACAIHGSDANRSDRERIGLSITYVSPEVRDCPYPMIRARGRADLAGFHLFEPPGDRDLAQEIAALDQFLSRRRRSVGIRG
jgi:hypothetical protein